MRDTTKYKFRGHAIRVVVLGSLLITFLSVASADAGLTVEKYKEAKSLSWFKVYIGGIGQGISIANMSLKVDQKPTLYCPPEDKMLDSDDYISLIDAYLAKNKDTLTLETPISAVLLYTLKEAYPCSNRLEKRR